MYGAASRCRCCLLAATKSSDKLSLNGLRLLYGDFAKSQAARRRRRLHQHQHHQRTLYVVMQYCMFPLVYVWGCQVVCYAAVSLAVCLKSSWFVVKLQQLLKFVVAVGVWCLCVCVCIYDTELNKCSQCTVMLKCTQILLHEKPCDIRYG